jgi:hypothetical protein
MRVAAGGGSAHPADAGRGRVLNYQPASRPMPGLRSGWAIQLPHQRLNLPACQLRPALGNLGAPIQRRHALLSPAQLHRRVCGRALGGLGTAQKGRNDPPRVGSTVVSARQQPQLAQHLLHPYLVWPCGAGLHAAGRLFKYWAQSVVSLKRAPKNSAGVLRLARGGCVDIGRAAVARGVR